MVNGGWFWPKIRGFEKPVLYCTVLQALKLMFYLINNGVMWPII